MTPSDIENLQTVGMEAQQKRKEFILRDDQAAAWEYLKNLGESGNHRCDFILDNGMLNPALGPVD
jgi:damage-control phosphatase, subfamily III